MNYYLSFIFILLTTSLFSQITNVGDEKSIEVQFDEYENPIVYYKLEKGQSLYNITKLFHAPVDLVLKYNSIAKVDEIPAGKEIKIPVDFSYTFRGESISGYKNTKFIPLVYQVKPKDNLFRLAKIYCGESVTDMMQRNGLESKDLNIGQTLILGWLPLDSKSVQFYSKLPEKQVPTLVKVTDKDEYVVMVNDENPRSNLLKNREELLNESDNIDSLNSHVKFAKKEKGIAVWTKASKGHSKYVLHPTAKLNSEIELYNPLVNRYVKAKVVGRIPQGAYTDDVSIIISPATAVSLGALDSRFNVVMTYTE